MKKIIIAIDGYSACGKSTTAKLVAAQSGYAYVDTGAMYRAVTLYFLEHFVNTGNPKAVEKALEEVHITFHRNERTGANETFLNGLNVESQIRGLLVSNKASEMSAIPEVRHAMVAQQQKMGKKRGLVMDGRDIGTHVFPDAELKIFMQADMSVRAMRRQQELLEKGQMVSLEEVVANIAQRDYQDTTRKENPLRRADDAYLLDTTRLEIDEQVNMVLQLMQNKLGNTIASY
jgi:CMP/dCMP kinase